MSQFHMISLYIYIDNILCFFVNETRNLFPKERESRTELLNSNFPFAINELSTLSLLRRFFQQIPNPSYDIGKNTCIMRIKRVIPCKRKKKFSQIWLEAQISYTFIETRKVKLSTKFCHQQLCTWNCISTTDHICKIFQICCKNFLYCVQYDLMEKKFHFEEMKRLQI